MAGFLLLVELSLSRPLRSPRRERPLCIDDLPPRNLELRLFCATSLSIAAGCWARMSTSRDKLSQEPCAPASGY